MSFSTISVYLDFEITARQAFKSVFSNSTTKAYRFNLGIGTGNSTQF